MPIAGLGPLTPSLGVRGHSHSEVRFNEVCGGGEVKQSPLMNRSGLESCYRSFGGS
jgi:hypothetical protein